MRLTDINPLLFTSHYDTPDEQTQIKQNFIKNGFPAIDIICDGELHRFPTSDKKDDDAGWYVFFKDVFTAGIYGDWRSGRTITFCVSTGRELTASELERQKNAIAHAKIKRDIAKKELNAQAAIRAQKIIEESIPATNDYPYLKSKKVQALENTFISNGSFCVPVFDYTGRLTSIQFINSSGDKKFLYGGEVKNCFFTIGQIGKKIFICEGYATGATIHAATGCAVVVCFSAGNIKGVSQLLRTRYGTIELVIVADNDESKTGEKAANEAAELTGASVIMPPNVGQDINDYYLSGGNVAELLAPQKKPWLIAADDFCSKPSPIKWIVKHWLPEESLIMVHGASGSGKTFFVLDLCLHAAAGFNLWHGSPVNPATIVYLAGEGHAGLKARIAAWKQEFKPDKPLQMYVSQSGRNLDNEIYRQKIIEDIRAIGTPPKLIVIDTLHRFMEGDENSSQDAGTFIDACSVLREEFNCSVLIVHHTGNNEDAQKRARGSSAWRAALDIEISVKPPAKMSNTLTIEQLKNKDAELAKEIYLNREVVNINGWIDEDGEQVTSLILRQGEKVIDNTKAQEAISTLKMYENIWKNGEQAKDENEEPYITIDELTEMYKGFGMNESGASKKITKELKELMSAGKIKQTNGRLVFLDRTTFLRLTT